jgi:hypothetical protein
MALISMTAIAVMPTASRPTANSWFSIRTRRCDSAATRAPCLFSAGVLRPRSSTRRWRPPWTRWLISALWIQVCSQTHTAHLSRLPHRCQLSPAPNPDLTWALLTGDLQRSWFHQHQCHPAQEVRDAESRGRAESEQGMKCTHAQSAVCSCQVRVADRRGVMFNLERSLFTIVKRQAKLFKRDAIGCPMLLPPWYVGYHLYDVDQVSLRRSG